MECPRCHQDNTSDSRFCRYCAAPLGSERDGAEDETRRTPEPGLDLLAGDRIAGKYKILRKVGEGGMGVVYEAEDIRLKRRVALKFLSPEQVRAPEAKQRFFREARASSKLDHPNICTIYEIDEDADRRFFIAMAFCPGESVRDKIKRGPLAVPEALEITLQVGRGLASAHEQGIVHRDIKPGNIMGTGTGEVKIVDFGLAKLVEDTGITRTAGMTGTLAYMSPEQIQGEHLDFRTDIWSLGVVMYEMFTGLHPFKGETAQELIYSVLNSSPAPPSEIRDALPGRLDGIVLKCLAKDRRHRYQTIRSLVSDLEQLKGSPGEGARTGPAPEKPPAARKESEQRQATVMFVEARGIPEMLETVDPQETSSFLKRFRACFDFIEDSYGGQVDRITDSIVRAVFGYPAAVEDAPAKAVRAALVLQRSLVDWAASENIGTPLKPCFGISSGTVIVGTAGTGEDRRHAITGDAVAMASQYKDLAKGGAVVIGPEAFRETQEAFAYRPLKPVSLRGRDKPVRLYELLAVKERTARLRLGKERIISSELVGREKERDLLMLHVMKAVNGEGSIVNLIGEAGIGKSALVADLKANPIMAKVGLIEGSALSIGKNLSFHPLIDALRDWAGIAEDDGATESLRKLERSIRGLGPEGPEEIYPFVATLMGLRVTGAAAERLKGIEGEALEKLILKSLRELLVKASRARPLVMILEDLHWADLTSIRFLESLYRLAENNRILFVNVFRPDYEETSQRLLQTIGSRYGRIRLDLFLDPLDEAESEELISNLLKLSAVPPTARELIVERTGGNPFFIEEVLRSFIDDGVVEVRDGAFQITDRINSVVIPKTIHQLLMARIDKLDEDTRSLLKVAAVIGRSFLYRILADVAGTIPEIDLKLDVLKEGQLIRERRVGGEVELLFKHALVQEVTYESILPKKRKDLHRKIAEAIESIYAGRISDFYGMLALHFGKAEDLEKTEAYLIRAGREALKSSASDEALHYYQEALKIYLAKSGRAADPEKVAMLRRNIGIALFDRGRLFEAIDHFEAAMTLYGAKKPRGMIASFVR
ncbi:MAG: protein kinase, partial [Candidatus Aminicenantes bacterium]|nr:protein kinase [Candidatus Aminicenantes bacterium]